MREILLVSTYAALLPLMAAGPMDLTTCMRSSVASMPTRAHLLAASDMTSAARVTPRDTIRLSLMSSILPDAQLQEGAHLRARCVNVNAPSVDGQRVVRTEKYSDTQPFPRILQRQRTDADDRGAEAGGDGAPCAAGGEFDEDTAGEPPPSYEGEPRQFVPDKEKEAAEPPWTPAALHAAFVSDYIQGCASARALAAARLTAFGDEFEQRCLSSCESCPECFGTVFAVQSSRVVTLVLQSAAVNVNVPILVCKNRDSKHQVFHVSPLTVGYFPEASFRTISEKRLLRPTSLARRLGWELSKHLPCYEALRHMCCAE